MENEDAKQALPEAPCEVHREMLCPNERVRIDCDLSHPSSPFTVSAF